MTDFISHLTLLCSFLLGLLCGNRPAYFPPGLFAEDVAYDQAGAETAAEYLTVFGEQPLFPAPETGEIYRFLWLRSFDPAVVVKVARVHGDMAIKAGLLPGASPKGQPELRQRHGTAEEWGSLVSALDTADFWGSLETKPTPAGEVVIDGSRWILEGVRNGTYKAVERVFPREDDQPFIDLGIEFLRLGGIDVEKEDVY